MVRELIAPIYELAKAACRESPHRFAPKKFTQSQLLALVLLRHFLGLSLRDLCARLVTEPSLARTLGLKRLPHYTTLYHAERRLKARYPDVATLLEVLEPVGGTQ